MEGKKRDTKGRFKAKYKKPVKKRSGVKKKMTSGLDHSYDDDAVFPKIEDLSYLSKYATRDGWKDGPRIVEFSVLLRNDKYG